MIGDTKINKNTHHQHYSLIHLIKRFGDKESFCIRRDWFKRWMSSLSFFWDFAESRNTETIVKFSQIDNDFIYNIFNKEFSNTLLIKNGFAKCTSKLIKNSNQMNIHAQNISHLFLSQYYWTDNLNCNYEFDIENLSEVERFIGNKFDCEFQIKKENASINKESKIVINDELKNHIWNTFEKPFYKSKKILI